MTRESGPTAPTPLEKQAMWQSIRDCVKVELPFHRPPLSPLKKVALKFAAFTATVCTIFGTPTPQNTAAEAVRVPHEIGAQGPIHNPTYSSVDIAPPFLIAMTGLDDADPTHGTVVSGTIPSKIHAGKIFLGKGVTCTAQLLNVDLPDDMQVGFLADHCLPQYILAPPDPDKFTPIGDDAYFAYNPNGNLNTTGTTRFPVLGVSRNVEASSSECYAKRGCAPYDLALFLIHGATQVPKVKFSNHVPPTGTGITLIGYGKGSEVAARQYTGTVSQPCDTDMVCVTDSNRGLVNFGDSGAAGMEGGTAFGVLSRVRQVDSANGALNDPRFATFKANSNYLTRMLWGADKGRLYIDKEPVARLQYAKVIDDPNNIYQIFSQGPGVQMDPQAIVNFLIKPDVPNAGCKLVITNLKNGQYSSNADELNGGPVIKITGTTPIKFNAEFKPRPGENCRGATATILDVLVTGNGLIFRAVPISEYDKNIHVQSVAQDIGTKGGYQVYIPVYVQTAQQTAPKP